MRRYPDRGMHGRVVETLGQRIVGGELGPDSALEADRIAEEFDVSRTVVREAFRVLAGKGLVDARPRRGTFARERENWNLLDPDVMRWQYDNRKEDSFAQLHEMRLMVEPAAAELAAMRRTEADLEHLREALQHMSESESSPELVAEADLNFHLGVITATHNELIEQLSVVIGIGLEARDKWVHSHGVPIEPALPPHRLVLDAIEARQPAEARAGMIALLEEAASDVPETPRD